MQKSKLQIKIQNFKIEEDLSGATFFKKNCVGFTLIEVLIIVGILGMFAAISVASYFTFYSKSKIDSVAKDIVNVLRYAQSRTLASENELNYGVHFEISKYVLFSGLVYNSTSTSNSVFNLPSGIQISNIAFQSSTSSDIIFSRITGQVPNFGDITILDTRNNLSRLVKVDSTGIVSLYEQENLPQTGARITDSRHVHFDLGWSIQNSTTLTFVFSDPPNLDIVKNVAMASYFDADKSSFSWEGEYEIYGSIQKLKINTHFLNGTATLLSVHRDGRYNNKAVKISIDGKDIAQYAATSTVSVLGFGGAMEIQ